MLLLRLSILVLLGLSAHGYYWENVLSPDTYPADAVYYQSSTGTYASCGYIDSAVGRQLRGESRCYIPFNSEEFEVVLPYDVLVAEPYAEFMIWTVMTSADEIRDNGVQVCSNCASGSDLYVCASTEWGPGKLVVRDDGSVNCYVSWAGDEQTVGDFITLTQQPANEYVITDVNYYLDDLEVLEDTPLQLTELTVINTDPDQTQTSTQTLEYSKTSSNEWENAYGFAIGVTMSVSAGIPLFFETGWEVSVEESWSYAYGQAWSETITTSSTAELSVPPLSSCTVTMVAREIFADVPYDATAQVIFPDGTTTTELITGVYEGLSVNSDQIVYEPCVPI